MTLLRATKLREAPRALKPEPLTLENWGYYINTDEARGSLAVPRIILQLQQAQQEPAPFHCLFAGHSGCGKSTELIRVSRELHKEYEVQVFQVQERYSLTTLDYRQLLFLCAQLIVDRARDLKVSLDPEQVSTLLDWFDRKTVEEVQKRGHKISAEAGGKLDFLSALYLKVAGEIFSGGETQTKAIKHIEERLDQLIFNMQVLVRAVEGQIHPRRLLLVLEGLDKIEDLDQARRLFIDHRPQILRSRRA